MKIVTLTLNPALDKNAKIEKLVPYEKLSSYDVTYHPGGGGINVSRVLQRLDVHSSCVFPYGGKTGERLVELLEKDNLNVFATAISSDTRENFAVLDSSDNNQYRFSMPTIPYDIQEMEVLKTKINSLLGYGDVLVLSGSMPPGLPTDYYNQLIDCFEAKNVKIVVDTSKSALLEVLKEKLFMIKPNLIELAALAGKEDLTYEEQKKFASELIANGNVEYVVVSRGKDGAFMACNQGIFEVEPPKLKVTSTVGAGDSMLAGLLYAYTNNLNPEEMLKWGVACGTAATQSEGSDLAQKYKVDEILRMLE